MKPLILIGLVCFGGAYWFAQEASELNRKTYPWFFDKNVEQPIVFNGNGIQERQAEASREVRKLDGYSGLCVLGGIGCIGTGLVVGAVRKVFGSPKTRRDSIDSPLLGLSDNDVMSVRDVLAGGVLVMGKTGSGKSSSSGRVIAESLVGHGNSGGLILAAKPEDLAMWQGIFERAGRDDLLVFSPESDLRFNFLDYEMRHGGHTRNITKVITTIGETLRSSDTKGGGEDGDYWEQQQTRMIYNAVQVVKLSTGRVDAWDLQRFISGAAKNPGEIANQEWQAGFHNQCLSAAHGANKNPVDRHDLDLAMQFWLGEVPYLADRTRSSIEAGVMGILHVFNTGVVRELVSTTTNVTPDDMFSGKWLLVNMAPAEWGDIGSFVAAGWKYLAQRAVLRREATPGDSIHVIFCDEAQLFVNSHDAHYLAQCRSHLGCMIFLTQSKHSFYSTLKGQAGRHQTDALLSNFNTKIFHALGDSETAEWASSLIGKSLQAFMSGSGQEEQDIFGAMMGHGNYSGGFSEHMESILQPNEFMNGLRCGGAADGYACDAIVVRSGKPFSSGDNWLSVAFAQRR